MKKLNLLLVVLLICASGYAQKPSQEEKAAIEEAITYARSIASVYVPKRWPSMENPTFVSYIYTGRGNILDAFIEERDSTNPFSKKLGLIKFKFSQGMLGGYRDSYERTAGAYVLKVPRNGSIIEKTKKGEEFPIDTITFNFEAGKHYTINGGIDKDNKIEFSIKETDTTAYLEYQKANPNRFDGTWSSEKKGKGVKEVSSNQYFFDGNKMKFEGKTTGFSIGSKKTYSTEGRIMYNENTIIFFPEKAAFNGKELKDTKSYTGNTAYYISTAYVWYYTLSNNELKIEGDALRYNTGYDNSGEYQKVQ